MIVQRLFIHDSVDSAALVLSWFTLFFVLKYTETKVYFFGLWPSISYTPYLTTKNIYILKLL